METKVYQHLAIAFTAMQNCEKSNNQEYFDKWENDINTIIDNLPHGSGIDGATQFSINKSKTNRLIITSQYHVMNNDGYYMNWIYFTMTIKPDLQFGYDLTIKGNFGKNQDLKEYLGETFGYALDMPYKEN